MVSVKLSATQGFYPFGLYHCLVMSNSNGVIFQCTCGNLSELIYELRITILSFTMYNMIVFRVDASIVSYYCVPIYYFIWQYNALILWVKYPPDIDAMLSNWVTNSWCSNYCFYYLLFLLLLYLSHQVNCASFFILFTLLLH